MDLDSREVRFFGINARNRNICTFISLKQNSFFRRLLFVICNEFHYGKEGNVKFVKMIILSIDLKSPLSVKVQIFYLISNKILFI